MEDNNLEKYIKLYTLLETSPKTVEKVLEDELVANPFDAKLYFLRLLLKASGGTIEKIKTITQMLNKEDYGFAMKFGNDKEKAYFKDFYYGTYYGYGIKYLNERDYDNSLVFFKLACGYKDSIEKIDEIHRILDSTYKRATELYKNYKFKEAKELTERALKHEWNIFDKNEDDYLNKVKSLNTALEQLAHLTEEEFKKMSQDSAGMKIGSLDRVKDKETREAMQNFIASSVYKREEAEKKKAQENKQKLIKKVIAIAAIVLVVIIAIVIYRSTDLYKYRYRTENGAVTLVEYRGRDKTVKIKETHNGKKVVKIGEEAFSGNKKVQTIILPDTIEVIDDYAFSGATKLKKINIPNGVKTIGEGAFGSTRSLQSIELPDSVVKLGLRCFTSSGLVSFRVPKGLEELVYAFPNCDKLEEIDLGSNLKKIENCAFYDDVSLTTVKGGENVTHVGEACFKGCTSLKNISLKSLATLGKSCFMDAGLGEFILPEGVVEIPKAAFSGCFKIKLYLPHSLKYVGYDGIEWYMGGGDVYYNGTRDEFAYDVQFASSFEKGQLDVVYLK